MLLIESFIRAVPKVELHLHLVGSASPTTVAAFAATCPEAGVPTSVTELESWFEFTSFPHFVELYAQVSSLIRSGEHIAMIVAGAATDLADQNVRYAEITVTPYTHLCAGIPYEEIVDGLAAGHAAARRCGVEVAWIFDIVLPTARDRVSEPQCQRIQEVLPGIVRFDPDGLPAR